MTELHLLPRPRQLTLTGAALDPRSLPVREVIDPASPAEPGPEAYRLAIDPSGIVLAARTPVGMRWARATLRQLRAHPTVPALIIEDAPRFAHRGVMLDISRDRVPSLATLQKLVDQLADWKMNHLQLYVENTLAYEGHQEAWLGASPLTLDELSALDAIAAARGISLNANQNCLGHFERWLRHPRYTPMAECPVGHLVRDEFYVPPNTLCPLDPRVLPFIEDLLAQQLPRCSGPYANIGCDEPWDLGKGRSREACLSRGRARVFSDYLRELAERVTRLGKRPQFWCDPEPNEEDGLPRDLVALVWGYEATGTFAPRVHAHKVQGREVWVAPGTSCWNSTTGRTWNRRANLDMAAAETDAAGLLCTAWGDGGHRQPWPITLMGFADAAMAAWSGSGHFDDQAAGQQAFGCPALGGWLAELGDVDEDLCRGRLPAWNARDPSTPIHNATALWKELHRPFFEQQGPGQVPEWEAVKGRLEALSHRLPEGIDPLLAAECRFALEMAVWTTDRALLRRSAPTVRARQDLAARMAVLIADHRAHWLARCHYGGLEDSTAHFARFASQW